MFSPGLFQKTSKKRRCCRPMYFIVPFCAALSVIPLAVHLRITFALKYGNTDPHNRTNFMDTSGSGSDSNRDISCAMDGSLRRKTNLTGRLNKASTVTAHDSGSRLREFQSSLQEAERLAMVMLNFQDAKSPQLTIENCTRLVLNETLLQSPEQNETSAITTGTTARTLADIVRSTRNCTSYLLESGFRFAQVSDEELSFPLAFSLLVYKDAQQVERLLRAVYRPHNVYCVHIDNKSDPLFQSAVGSVAGCLPNVFIADKAMDVRWGTITVLEPEMECMRRLLAHRAKWRYFINLTGQEFPLKTNKELVQILKTLKGANIITGTLDKIFHFRWRNPKPVPYNVTINKGDVHIAASRGYVDYVINSHVARDVYEWLRYSFIPDESFFSTMNFNPKLGVPGSFVGPTQKRISTSPRCYKIWQFTADAILCRGKFVRNVCHFGIGNLPGLTNSQFLIANKFSYDYQPSVFDCVEKWYFEKVRMENEGLAKPLNVSFYQLSDMVRYRYTGPVIIWE